MWSLITDHAREKANEAKSEAIAAGKSQAEADAASERAYRGEMLNTAKKHLGAEWKIAKIISGIFD
jgi:hypothetical protein